MRMRSEREHVGGSFYRRKPVTTEDFNGHTSGKLRQIELNHLRKARKIYHDEDGFVFVAAEKGENFGVVRKKKLESAAGKGAEIFSRCDDAAHPPEKRGQIFLLIFYVDRLEVVFRIDDDRQMQLLRIGQGKTGVAIGTPLHRRAAAVAIAEVNVVTHSDFVPVINDWRAGHGEKHGVEQLHFAPAVGEQGSETAADSEIDARVRIVGVNAPHVVALLV